MVRRRVGTCSARPSRRRSSPPASPPSPAGPRPRSAALMFAPAEIPARMPSRWAARRAVSSASSSETAIVSSITRAVEHLGHEAGADPLDLVRAGRAAGEHRRGRRLDRDDQRLRAALAQHAADPGDRPAGADAGDEGADLAVGVAPDLLGRAAAMDLRVGGVGELLRHEALALLADLSRPARPPRSSRPATASHAPRRRRRAGASPARGSSPRAWSGSARSRAPRRPSPARSRCCRWSARRSPSGRARSAPSSSAASIIATPIRSLTEPPGLKYSSFAQTSAFRPSASRFRATSGVPPTTPEASAPIRIS